MFDDEKISLDRSTFRVLSSDTRIQILKLLGKRRMTLSEMSKFLRMSVSSVKEHLDSLSQAGLIVQMDEGRKWKYYELTGKGKEIISPVEKRVFIVLGVSVLAAVSGLYGLVGKLSPPRFSVAEGMLVREAAPVSQTLPLPLLEIVVVAAAFLAAGISIGYLYTRMRRPGGI